MGNAFSQPAPNQVDILQQGGCSGGGSCGIAAPTFDANNMDARLQPYLTPQEYTGVINEANEVLKRKAPTCKIAFCILPVMLLTLPTGFFISKGPSYACKAPNGMCMEGQDPSKDGCCAATCCRKSGRLLAEEFHNGGNISDYWLQNMTIDEKSHNASGFLKYLPTDDDATGATERSLLSPRSLQQFNGGCKPFHEGGSPDMIPEDCLCRQAGKKRVCDGVVNIEGQTEHDKGLRWLMAITLPVQMAGTLLPIGYSVYLNCNLPQYINPVLQPWAKKQLQAQYRRGSKHYQARICVFTPQVQTVMGQVVQA